MHVSDGTNQQKYTSVLGARGTSRDSAMEGFYQKCMLS
jgi:hypothetical protein